MERGPRGSHNNKGRKWSINNEKRQERRESVIYVCYSTGRIQNHSLLCALGKEQHQHHIMVNIYICVTGANKVLIMWPRPTVLRGDWPGHAHADRSLLWLLGALNVHR